MFTILGIIFTCIGTIWATILLGFYLGDRELARMESDDPDPNIEPVVLDLEDVELPLRRRFIDLDLMFRRFK